MADQTTSDSVTGDLIKPKRKWRWLKITLAIIFGVFFLLKILGSYNPVHLELTRRNLFDVNRDGMALEIVNVGQKPIVISAININDRSDCTVDRLSFTSSAPLLPATLKVGDKLLLTSSCRIIRANVTTADGSNTYSFAAE